MILILSIKEDIATSNVIDWLNYYKTDYIRVNDTNIDLKIELSDKCERITETSKLFNLNKVSSYWYRRGNFNISLKTFEKNINIATESFNQFYYNETGFIQKYLHSSLNDNTNSLNGISEIYQSKLYILKLAKKCGLNIPDTLITNKKAEVLLFSKKHPEIITKAIREGFSFIMNNVSYYFHSILLNKNDVDTFPLDFNYILLQQAIRKKYELRVFYLNEDFYASAVFSQNDEKTKIDFRNYNKEKPNRVVPYLLPKQLKYKLKSLMKNLNFKSGSFDIIVNEKGEYIFLEVNPTGQFTQVSKPCNYFLEKKIALSLIQDGKRNKKP